MFRTSQNFALNYSLFVVKQLIAHEFTEYESMYSRYFITQGSNINNLSREQVSVILCCAHDDRNLLSQRVNFLTIPLLFEFRLHACHSAPARERTVRRVRTFLGQKRRDE